MTKTLIFSFLIFLLICLNDCYKTPNIEKITYVLDFQQTSKTSWTPIFNEKYNGKWSFEERTSPNAITGDIAAKLSEKAKHYALISEIKPLIEPTEKDLIIQYEVKFENGIDCGGAYIKLLTYDKNLNFENFNDKTPYTIMFGPDKCGSESKVHFIFRHKNPITGVYEEKHLANPPNIIKDKLSHLYTLVVRKDNTFEILIDQNVAIEGNLLENFQPAVNPPKEIPDSSDIKPANWIDDEEIIDTSAKKPEDWNENEPEFIIDSSAVKPENWNENEPEFIPDPSAVKPEDWNDEEDGEWVAETIRNPNCESFGCGKWSAPTIQNPNYRGKWSAPMIPNPKFIGKWKPRNIPNPNYFEDLHPHNFDNIGNVAIEIWTMNDGITFDNILLTHDEAAANEFAEKTWRIRFATENQIISEEKKSLEPIWYIEYWNEFKYYWNKQANENPLLLGITTGLALAVPLLFCFGIYMRKSRKAPRIQQQSTTSTISNGNNNNQNQSNDDKKTQ
eukprot:TRINITY_DN2575_c0_g1_i1.p1 TRINITY_DN2575_c0_g1~~TRINITY_DN2575_c0_g1_i1.p1  ORF type:complete len:504 (-),score=234.82 TRINITY_DN2575_c0_g1_i1:1081-2592(-)